jgi:hypothetical protein
MAAQVMSDAVLRRAVVGLRRYARTSVKAEINSLERSLEQVWSDVLPIARPRRRAREYDWTALLCDWRGRSLTYKGDRIMVPGSSRGIDDLTEWLLWNRGPVDAGVEDLLTTIGREFRVAQSLRGRGGYYGLISNGVDPRFADFVATADREAERVFAQDHLTFAVKQLRDEIDQALVKIGPDDCELYIDALRGVFARLQHEDEVPETEFASLITGSPEVFEIVDMLIWCSPWLPRRLSCFSSWRTLVADTLGVRPIEHQLRC